MPLVTLREGVQPLIFPTDLSLDKPIVGVTKIKLDPNDRKTPIESDTPPEELSGNASNNRSSTPRNILTAEKLCTSSTSKLKHLTEEEATALMLKAAAEKSSNAAAAAAASNNSGNLSDTSYGGDDNVGGGTGSDFHSTLSGAVAFAADVGSAAGLCNINILNSINAMNSLISGNASSGSVSLSGPLSSSNNVSGNGSNPSGTSGSGGGHPCPVCGRVYKLKSSLRNHQKWECGKEPQFQCPFCVYRAKQKMHIGRHMERMHKEKFIKLEDLKSYTGSDESTASAVAAAATAAANALASTAELHQHFT